MRVGLKVSHDIAIGEIRSDKAWQSKPPVKICRSPEEWDNVGMVECQPDLNLSAKLFGHTTLCLVSGTSTPDDLDCDLSWRKVSGEQPFDRFEGS